MKKVSRFAAQPKGAYGNVAPPSFRGGQPTVGLAAFTHAASVPQAPSRPVRDYFDEDDDNDVVDCSKQSDAVDDDDYDPLDDFM